MVIGLAVIVVQVCCMPPLNAQPRRPSHCPMRAKQCPAAKRTCTETPRQLITTGCRSNAGFAILSRESFILMNNVLLVAAIVAAPVLAYAPHTSEPSHWLTPTRTIQLRI